VPAHLHRQRFDAEHPFQVFAESDSAAIVALFAKYQVVICPMLRSSTNTLVLPINQYCLFVGSVDLLLHQKKRRGEKTGSLPSLPSR